MRFWFILVVYSGMAWSTSSPTAWVRDRETMPDTQPPASRKGSIILYPTDPTNTTQLLETNKFLTGLYGENNVKPNPDGDAFSWTVTFIRDETTNPLRGYPGLNFDGKTGVSKRVEVAKRNDLYYIAIAANPEDDSETKATFEFLKITNSNERIVELHSTGTSHVTARGNLQLTSDAKAIVEAYAA